MKLFYFLFFFTCCSLTGYAQIDPAAREGGANRQPTQEERISAPVSDYKIISVENDTTFVDTTLHIFKDYRFNYLRKDLFEVLPFANVGQSYNRLSYSFSDDDLLPRFGARARHFNYMEVEDVHYYHVPTPLTELYFRTVYEQGQTLDALFTVNTTRNFNLSIAYKGSRSLGRYRNSLTSTGNFRATLNYNTRGQRYFLRSHFTSQDLMNQENGGLTSRAMELYLAEDPEFEDRARLDVNFEDAENILLGKRFFLDHYFNLTGSGDEETESFSIGHTFMFSDKEYRFEKGSAGDLLGPSFESINLRDEVELEELYNEASLRYSGSAIGNFAVKAAMTNFNYGYNAVLDLERGYIPNRLVGEVLSAGGEYEGEIGDFSVEAEAMVNVSGDFTGNNFKATLAYDLNELTRAWAGVRGNESAPDYHFLLYQSDYVNYNWRNEFSNEVTAGAFAGFTSPLLGMWSADYTTINDYAYFGLDGNGMVSPFQYGGSVDYFRVKGVKEFSLGKISLMNTVMYQEVLQGEDVLNVPSLITRNSLYYSDHWFRRALYLQTGFTVKYFTGYYMNGYDPVLAEYFVQNQVEIDGFPTVDFFFNGKIRQARIFFKLEHLNALLMGNNNLSAPGYPYGDFAVRFGLVWNFFM